MTSKNPRANDIFLKALKLRSADSRRMFLDKACGGDAALRAEVDALLHASARAAGRREPRAVALPAPLDREPAEAKEQPHTVDEPITERPGATIGPYKLLEQIGEGGFGVVFMAEQHEPVRRKVALKVLKPGMDTRQVVARFEAERQALAIMDHPNIAKVFDGGISNSGRPFFVMELVKGTPITTYCDQYQLTPRQRLEIFVPVCQAVQHAHQKGIIHRDLKPSNVLVAMHDTMPVVKVIDFGVAKAVGQELTDKTLFTGLAQMIGTPLYMSPEQAGQSSLDIDTRSDIYSLGVLLYELLTGTTPFDRERFKQAAFDEIRRIIREEDPPKPSTRLNSSKDSLPSISIHRQTEPRKLTRLVRGDLDWIVMKCLEKDRNRRYETANGLAMDLQRYLRDEPIVAGPPSASYRFAKFLKRNRGSVVAAGIVLLALLAGLAGTTWGLVRALKAEEAARDQESKATANFQLARDAVEEYCSKVSNDPRLKEKDLEQLRKELLQSAMKFHEKFVEQHRENVNSRADLARACFDLAKLSFDIEDPKRATELCRLSVSIYEQLATEHPEVVDHAIHLTACLDKLGAILHDANQAQEARGLHYRALDILDDIRRSHGDLPEARSAYLRNCYHLCYLLTFKMGAHQEALDACRRGVAYLEGERRQTPLATEDAVDRAELFAMFGMELVKTRARDEGIRWCEKALQLIETVPRNDARTNERRAGVYASVGRAYHLVHELPRALDMFQKEVDIYQQLVAAHPGMLSYQDGIGRELNSLGMVQSAAGMRAAALDSFQKSLTVKQALVDRYPELPDYKANLARSLGNVALHLSDPAQAEEYRRRSEVLLKELTAQFPKVTQYRDSLILFYHNRAVVFRKNHQIPEAIQALDNQIAQLDELLRQTDLEDYRQKRAHCFVQKAELYYQSGTQLMNERRLEPAIEALQKSIALMPDVAEAHCNLGHCYLRKGRYEDGLNALKRGHELSKKQSNWQYPSGVWVSMAEQFVQLERRLPAILAGTDQLTNVGERLITARICHEHKHLYAAAARYYAEAFTELPNVAGDLTAQHRYIAACSAAPAGCGQGADADKLDAGHRAELRKQALEWLRADLTAWEKLAGDPQQQDRLVKTLKRWQEDEDLAGVRDPDGLTTLPTAEREEWQHLWTDVELLIKQCAAGPTVAK